MAQTARLNDRQSLREAGVAPAIAPVVVPVGGAAVEWAAESPARNLHQQLLQTFSAPPAVRDTRLPLRMRMAIIAAAVVAPWVAIAGVLLAVL